MSFVTEDSEGKMFVRSSLQVVMQANFSKSTMKNNVQGTWLRKSTTIKATGEIGY